jgi:F-type H+-transporting ATPase subunit b
MTHWTILLAAETAAKEGGLFDLDATLPLMAVQFLVLAAILNAIFYKPLTKAIDERSEYIRNNQKEARERLSKAQTLAQEYERKRGEALRESQAIVAQAQADAQKIAAEQIAQAQKEAQQAREQTQKEIDQQKQEALRSLEQQVDTLSRQILEKLLGPELANR